MRSAHHLAADLRNVGEVQASRDLAQDTLDRRRRVLGEDHRETLYSANNLGATLRALGEVQAAHDLDQDTLDRKRRVLGEDHPSTLTSANNLALDLRALGEVEAARDLDQDTLELKRRILGENHPDTLFSAHNLAADLRALGEVQAARKLDQDTLDRRRRVLGEDHPETLASAQNLAADLLALGDVDDDFGRRAGLRIPFVPGKRALRTRRKRGRLRPLPACRTGSQHPFEDLVGDGTADSPVQRGEQLAGFGCRQVVRHVSALYQRCAVVDSEYVRRVEDEGVR